MTAVIGSPHRPVRTMSRSHAASGREMAWKVHRWMEALEAAFREIYGFVKGMQLHGGRGRVRDRVAAFCVDRGIEVGDSPYTFNNTWWAGISRYLVLHDPSLLGDPIAFRESDIDCYGLLPVSYLPEIEPDTEVG